MRALWLLAMAAPQIDCSWTTTYTYDADDRLIERLDVVDTSTWRETATWDCPP